jgi:uncharacterized integral membrane protein
MFFVVLALFLLICGGLVVLTIQNLPTPVQFVFYTWHTPVTPAIFWIVGAFLLGALLFYLMLVVSARDDRRELRKLRKRVSELEEEKARSLSLGPARAPAPGDPQALAGPPRMPTSPPASGGPQVPMGPRRIPSSPLGLDAQIPMQPTGAPVEQLELSSPFMPMPGIYPSPPNSGASTLPMPDFRQ